MKRQNGLRQVDWAIVVGCVALALMTVGAVGESGRRRAKEAVCQANLHQWNGVFQGIIRENNGKFLSGVTDRGYWWPIQLPEDVQDWKRNRTWFCPTAASPVVEGERTLSSLSIFSAWGVYRMNAATYQDKTYHMTPNGLAGSYCLNGYVIPIPESINPSTTNTYESGVSAQSGWRDLLSVSTSSSVPMFLDGLRFDVWSRPWDAPPASVFAAWTGTDMARCCINRHDGTVSCLFVDGSVRKVGVKELWTLKWHRSFSTRGPYTKEGGVQPEDWPEWMRPFKEY